MGRKRDQFRILIADDETDLARVIFCTLQTKGHGAKILVQSEPEQGSMFSILLPIAMAAEKRGVRDACNENVSNL